MGVSIVIVGKDAKSKKNMRLSNGDKFITTSRDGALVFEVKGDAFKPIGKLSGGKWTGNVSEDIKKVVSGSN